jgi:hypothetical protein
MQIENSPCINDQSFPKQQEHSLKSEKDRNLRINPYLGFAR